MKREDRERDITARRENYQRGLIALNQAVGEFTELTGVDLTGDVDIAGRHMGEAPYLKITAERLIEITATIEGEVAIASDRVKEIAAVLPLERAHS